MDNIIPLLGTCSNRKEFLVKLDCLKSVVGVGIKVGKQTLAQYMLLIYIQFLNDSEELVVLEIIRTLASLLRMNLISKATLLDDYQSKNKNIVNHSLLEKLLPFLLHPNTWIREETLNFIIILCDHKHTKLLSKAEVYCMVRNKLKPYLQDAASATQFLMGDKAAEDLMKLLRIPLSRNTFEMVVKTDTRNFEDEQELKLSHSDKYAMEKLKFIIDMTQTQFQQGTQMKQEPVQRMSSNFWRKCKNYNQYRVVKMQTLETLGTEFQVDHDWQPSRGKDQSQMVLRHTEHYENTFFQPCHRTEHG